MYRGTKKPHCFTWNIWGLTTSVVFFSQLSEGAGPGAWVTGVSALLCFVIVGLSLWKNPKLEITRLDWVFFIAAMCSLPLWYFTSTPLWSVILLCVIDMAGYVPTLRKAYVLPHEESALLFAVQSVKCALAIAALEVYSLTTALFPATILMMNLLLIATIAAGHRRSAA